MQNKWELSDMGSMQAAGRIKNYIIRCCYFWVCSEQLKCRKRTPHYPSKYASRLSAVSYPSIALPAWEDDHNGNIDPPINTAHVGLEVRVSRRYWSSRNKEKHRRQILRSIVHYMHGHSRVIQQLTGEWMRIVHLSIQSANITVIQFIKSM